MSKEAMEKALEALHTASSCLDGYYIPPGKTTLPEIADAVAALHAALVEQPLTIERLRAALVASRVIPPEAVEDADNYDDGAMLGRIEALHRRIA